MSFGALQQDPRFSFIKDMKNETKTNTNNEILSKMKKLEMESLTVSQLQEVFSYINIDFIDFKLAILVLQKPTDHRSLNEINLLVKSVENVDFFQKYDNDTKEQICKFMTYQSMKKGETLFEIGSVGTTFYIILKGSIGIWVNIPKQLEEDSKKEVKTVTNGASFGELALLDKKPRAATIICKQNCHFGVFDKNAFDRILSNFNFIGIINIKRKI